MNAINNLNYYQNHPMYIIIIIIFILR